MKPPRTINAPRARSAGFTLMEMLLAVAVSAVVLSVISTIYFTALQLRNRTTRTFDELLPLQHALGVIQDDLASLAPPGGPLGGELQTTPGTSSANAGTMNLFSSGQRVSPDFFTVTGVIGEFTPFADVQRVAYFLVDPTNRPAAGRDLMRIISRNLLPATVEEPGAQWLLGGVETLYFQYFDGTTWLDTWDSTISSNLPTAIRLQLALAAEDGRQNDYLTAPVELVVPVAARSRTGQTQDPGGGQ
jgi:general secretion pathway protein J